MKLFYFGSVCGQKEFNETVEKSKVKPSASAQNFEYALIKGFAGIDDLDLTVVSAESIAMFPKGNRIFLKKRKDFLTENISAQIVSAINLPFLKQKDHAKGVYKKLLKWLKENKEDKNKAVLVYGLYPAVVKKILQLCKDNECCCFAIITDIPKTMFTYTNNGSLLKKLFSKRYRANAIKLQNLFDGYVYLTKQMHEEVAPNKPYTVVETIADSTIFDGINITDKSTPPAIMYAGALYKKYGVDKIIEVFENLNTDARLWLFGSGDYEQEIQIKQKQNSKICFFGRVCREEVLQREKGASLLLNIRNPNEEFTKYSFPSKTIEYMLSGTPLVTTKLSGIPKDYEGYVFFVNYEDTKGIANRIDELLCNREELIKFGNKARTFVIEQKNNTIQSKKIIDFIKTILG